MIEWYFEYEIHKNRPGLLGDVSSLIGMLGINIVTINGVDNARRGFCLCVIIKNRSLDLNQF